MDKYNNTHEQPSDNNFLYRENMSPDDFEQKAEKVEKDFTKQKEVELDDNQ